MDRLNRNILARIYPDTGPLRRELYPKHMAFFRAGTKHRERAAVAANRSGKTFGLGGYETTLHLTGKYPEWWEGRRFDGPIDAWVAGKTSETTRDIVQEALTGVGGEAEEGALGTGLIPLDDLVGVTRKGRPTGAFDVVSVRHVSGGISHLGFKAYDQGRPKFEGTARHLIWLDEEPPADVYDECMIRLMTHSGLMLCTFTPLEGLSEIVLRYLPNLAPSAEDAWNPAGHQTNGRAGNGHGEPPEAAENGHDEDFELIPAE